MDDNKLDRIIEAIEGEGLMVKVFETAENEIYEVTMSNGLHTSAGKGPVTVLIIREYP